MVDGFWDNVRAAAAIILLTVAIVLRFVGLFSDDAPSLIQSLILWHRVAQLQGRM